MRNQTKTKDRKNNLLDSIVLTPEAVRKWEQHCWLMRKLNDAKGIMAEPDMIEEAEALPDGRLKIFVDLGVQNGKHQEVSLVLPADDWAMAN